MKSKNSLKSLIIIIMIMMSMTTIHGADTNIIFDGNAEDFIFLNGSQDLFDNFKNIMPGEIREQDIVLKNTDHRELRFYLSAKVIDSLDKDTSGLSIYNISITNEDEEFYRGTLDDLAKLSAGRMSEDTLLATLQKGETTTIKMTLEVNGDSMDNTYQNREGLIQFKFSVEELDDATTIIEVVKNIYQQVRTGDISVITPMIGLIAGSGLVIIYLLRRKKDKEDRSYEDS